MDEISAEALLAEETRPRTFSSADGVLVIFRGVNLNPGADPEDMVGLRIWFEKDRIITVRLRRLLAVSDIAERVENGTGPKSSSDFLSMIADRLVVRMGPVIESLGEVIDQLETNLMESKPAEVRKGLRDLRHTSILLKRYLMPQRDVMSRLQAEEHAILSKRTKLQLREVGDRISRYVEDLEEIRDRSAVLQDELSNQLSETTNRTIYVLTIVAAIVLPLSFITGLLGINVGGIPGTDNDGAFLIVCLLIAVFGLAQVWIFRKLKWI
jgi:zinc transporter